MKRIAQFISFILQPLLMPTFGMLFLFQVDSFAYQAFEYKLYVILGTFLFSAILPLIAISILRKIGMVSTLFITNRRERTIPYLITLISYVLYIIFLRRVAMPNWVVAMMIGCTSSIILITLINLKWKISAHLSGIGGLTAAVFVVAYQLDYNPYWIFSGMILLSGLVATSRIVLRAHTPLQTLGGFCLGALCVALPGIIVL
jgi:membrane-associated phospholipid phosphatase